MSRDLELAQLRKEVGGGEQLTQVEVDALQGRLSDADRALSRDQSTELLPIVRSDGTPTGTLAPRWMCHLLGLRHPVVYTFLTWQSPVQGELALVQLRSLGKAASPGTFDIAVGGHVTGTASLMEAALRELHEELGLTPDDLVADSLAHLTGQERYDESPLGDHFNRQWSCVVLAKLKADALTRLSFQDREVSGLLLLPLKQLQELYRERRHWLAGGLLAEWKKIACEFGLAE